MMFLLFPEKHPIVDVKKAMKLLDPETARYDKIFRVMSSIQPMSGMMVATKKYVEGVDVENSSRASGASLLEEMAKAREIIEVGTTDKVVSDAKELIARGMLYLDTNKTLLSKDRVMLQKMLKHAGDHCALVYQRLLLDADQLFVDTIQHMGDCKNWLDLTDCVVELCSAEKAKVESMVQSVSRVLKGCSELATNEQGFHWGAYLGFGV